MNSPHDTLVFDGSTPAHTQNAQSSTRGLWIIAALLATADVLLILILIGKA